MKKINAYAKLAFWLVMSLEGCVVGMVRRTAPVLKKIAVPRVILEPGKMNAVLYVDPVSLEYRQRQQRYIDSMNRNAMNLGYSDYGKAWEPEIEYSFDDIVRKDVDPERGFDLTKSGLSKIDALARRAKELGLYLDVDVDGDDNDEDLFEAVQSVAENLKLGDVVKKVEIEKPLERQNVMQQLEKAKLDSFYEVIQAFGLQSDFVNKKDVLNFLNSIVVKDTQGYMSLKIKDVLELLKYDVNYSFKKGLESNNVWVQIATLRSFFMPISFMGLPSAYPLYPAVLGNAFSHALCELLVGRSLTAEEFMKEKNRYGYWFHSLEKSVTLAFWIVSAYISFKVVEMAYADVKGYDPKFRREAQEILLMALGMK